MSETDVDIVILVEQYDCHLVFLFHINDYLLDGYLDINKGYLDTKYETLNSH